MEERQYYTCAYCYKEFEPNRRRVQKFCSTTCRVKAHHYKKTKDRILTTVSSEKIASISSQERINKVEQISAAVVGNAALGTLAVETAKAIFTLEDNKSATKGDLKRLAEQINGRHHLVKNMPQRNDGALPYYDMHTKEIVYLFLR